MNRLMEPRPSEEEEFATLLGEDAPELWDIPGDSQEELEGPQTDIYRRPRCHQEHFDGNDKAKLNRFLF